LLPEAKTILVTGADGLLGAQLIQDLRPLWQVHALVHSPPICPLADVQYHVRDLGADWKTEGLPQQLDAIVHLAQSSHFREVPEKALDVFNVNVASTARLLDFAYRIKTRKFVYASSGGIYGTGSHAFNENSPIGVPDCLGYYLGSKLCGEVLAQSYTAQMQVLILRFFFIYGPGQNRSMLILRLIDNVVAGRPVKLQGSHGIRINPIYVSDASRALVAALATGQSATYNVAGSEVLSLRDIAETIGTAVGRTPTFDVSEELGQDLVADNCAMLEHLHKPKVNFASGISRITQPDSYSNATLAG